MIFAILFIISIFKLSLILFILSLFAGAIEIFSLVWFSKWRNNTDDSNPNLTFRQFIHIYRVVPEKFELHQTYINYENSHYYNHVNFKTPIDYFRYRRFYENRDKYNKRMEKLNIQADFIKNIQRDLNSKQVEIDDFIREKVEI